MPNEMPRRTRQATDGKAEMSGANDGSEPDWMAFRRRARRRRTALIALVLEPFILVVTAIRVFEPHEYPHGDIRNEPLFWAVIGLVFVLFASTFLITAVRILRENP
jgi:hypothetical protein